MEARVKRTREVPRRSAHEKAPDPEDRRLYGMETESLCYGLTGSSLSLSEIRMMPPITAATARTAMLQLEPPSRPFFFETAEAERAPSNAVAAEAATGVATIEVAARDRRGTRLNS